jgi:hypothetical protein
MAATTDRIDPRQAHQRLGEGARLVCAYDSDEKFQHNHLEGAVSLGELRAQEGALPRDQELIFYCA